MQPPPIPRISLPALPAKAAAPALLFAPLAIAAAVMVGLWVARRTGERREHDDWLRRMVQSGELDPQRHEVLAFIRDTLLGLSRRSVRGLLGSPTAAGEHGLILDNPSRSRQQAAEAWYYRLDRAHPAGGAALVVEFEDDRASEAAFLVGSRR